MSGDRATITRRILLRRRRIDPWVLGTGIAALGFLLSFGKLAFLLFAACGLYLALLRPRSWRGAPRAYIALLAAWGLWQVVLSLARGEPVTDNRTLSYAALEVAAAFLPLGLTLVRDPVGALALGARFCLVLLTVATPVAALLSMSRVGLGGNEAIFAFVVGVIALAARLPVREAPRWLPDGRWWTYLVIVPVLLSGTRAAFALVPLAMAADAATLVRLRRPNWMRSAPVLAAAGIALAVLAVPAALLVQNRVQAGLDEVAAFERTGVAAGSVDTRLVMWRAGWQVLREHPVLGVGGTRRIEAAGEKAGRNGFMVVYYKHLHNAFLDEALSSGLVGLALLFLVFAAFLGAVLRRVPATPRVRSTAVLLVAFAGLLGFFHGILLNEWTLIALFGTMGTMLAGGMRRTVRAT